VTDLLEILEILVYFECYEIQDLSQKNRLIFGVWALESFRDVISILKVCVYIVNCSMDIFWNFRDMEMITV
jgi:hypothetical protein